MTKQPVPSRWSCSRDLRAHTRWLLRNAPHRAKKWATLAWQLAKDGYCRDATVYVRKVERMMAHSNSQLGGSVRTCVQYTCVRGRGKKNADAECRAGYVLRCAQYAPMPGLPVHAATRKPYQQFIYGRYHEGSGARALYPPDMPPPRDIAKKMRIDVAPVRSGRGRQR
jgi:hypothetical protein